MAYVPILKGKEAEYRALQELTPDIKATITPLIDLVPPGNEEDTEKSISSAAERLSKVWPDHPLLLDTEGISSASTATGEHPLLRLWHECRDRGISFTPVTGISRSEAYQEAAKEIATHPESAGLCIRIKGADFEGDFPVSSVMDLIHDFNLSAADVHLLLDFGSLMTDNAGPLALLMFAYLQSIPNLTSWRTVTVAGTSFPHDMGRFKPDSINRVARTEWNAWCLLLGKPLIRYPQFSDYAIQHPEMIAFDPKTMDVSAALRYAADQKWVIVKGRGLKKHKGTQMHSLCSKLIVLPEYKGPAFSAGDKWIDDCAKKRVNYGNSTVWRRVGTGHHLTLVARQIANLPGV